MLTSASKIHSLHTKISEVVTAIICLQNQLILSAKTRENHGLKRRFLKDCALLSKLIYSGRKVN